MLGKHTSDLDLRLMRIFLAVTDAKGISAAQSRLNVGQSTISTHLATLEARLGFRLCERGRAGFRLTAKGSKFAVSARRLLVTLDEFTSAVRSMDRHLAGTLNIGLIDHVSINQLARISEAIARFHKRNGAVKFAVVVRSPRDLEEQLLTGHIQVALGYFWHRVPSLSYTPLFVERQIACCGNCHPLFSSAGKVNAKEVAKYDWAWRTYPLPEAQQLSVPPEQVTAVADNMEAAVTLIMSGSHLAYLPEHFATPYIQKGLLGALNPAVLRYDVPFQLVIRRRAPSNELVHSFLEDLKSAGHPVRWMSSEDDAGDTPQGLVNRPPRKIARHAAPGSAEFIPTAEWMASST
jgi:DNA-binding transcriptional LysR family regulator